MHLQRIHKSARNCFTHYLSNINITLKLGTGLCWGLTCDRLVSHPEKVNDPHLLSTTETGDMQWLYAPNDKEKNLI